MSSRRSIVLLVLALLLGFAHQHAARHGLEHDFDRLHHAAQDPAHPERPQDGHPHETSTCAECVAIAALDQLDALPGIRFAGATFALATPVAPSDRHVPQASIERYRSRAPPVLP